MRGITRTWLAAAVLLAAGAGVLSAQTGTTLTLDDAIARGLAQAPRLAEARARESAAASTVTAKAAVRLPSVSATGQYLRTNHIDEFGVLQNGQQHIIFPDIPNNYGVRTQVDVPILPVGLALAVINSAKADVRALEADRHAAEADLRLDITRAYWTLVTARASVQVLEQAQERTDASVSDVKARVDAGFLPPNDLLSAQAQRARQAVQLIQAKNAASVAELDLARLIGAKPGEPLTLTSAVDQPLPGAAEIVALPVETLIARALEQRPERAGLKEQRVSVEEMGKASLASLQPQLGVHAGVEPARPNGRFVPRVDQWKTSWDVGVAMVWPLFDGGKARANHAAAVAQASAIDHRLEQFDEMVALDIRQRVLDLESGRAALAASDEAVAAATEARRVVDERFRAGVATSSDMLDAQVALVEAELERTRLSAAQRLSEARLVRAVGGA